MLLKIDRFWIVYASEIPNDSLAKTPESMPHAGQALFGLKPSREVLNLTSGSLQGGGCSLSICVLLCFASRVYLIRLSP